MAYNPFKNVSTLLGQYFKPTNPGRNVMGGGIPPLATTPGRNVTGGSYQVKTGDTFDSIAQQTNLTVPQIQQANNNMLVTPPKGSYINIPQPVQAGITDMFRPKQGPATPAGYNAPTGYGPYWQQKQLQRAQPPAIQPVRSPDRADDAFLRQMNNLTSQLSAGQLPTSISETTQKQLINPQTGQPFSNADLQNSGYTFNTATRQWVLGANVATPQKVNATQPMTNKERRAYNTSQGLMYHKFYGWIPREEWQALKRRGPEKPVVQQVIETPAEATNAGNNPGGTLDVQLAGG